MAHAFGRGRARSYRAGAAQPKDSLEDLEQRLLEQIEASCGRTRLWPHSDERISTLPLLRCPSCLGS